MLKPIRLAAALFFMLLSLPSIGAATAVVPPSFAELVETLSPAVVNIATRQKAPQGSGAQLQFRGIPEEDLGQFKEFLERFGGEGFGEGFGGGGSGGAAPAERDVTSLGSGFVIDPSGYIVTNNHVIEQAEEISVIFQDESEYAAKVVGRDAKTDLALLKIEAQNLPAVAFGDSDALRVGDWVLAIGNPFGLGGSVSAGIVSARSRDINAGPFDDFIQTDAAINRGNSGGPLFNIEGKVVGVNSAIFSPSGGNVGIGFSIPAALADPVLRQLREFGRTHRGWLGVQIQHVSKPIAESLGMPKPQGALVLEVTAGGPADKAGIKAGDVITAFDGNAIEEMRQLPRMVAETKVGKSVKLSVWQEEKTRNVSVTLGEMQEEDAVASAEQPNTAKEAPTPNATQQWMGAEVATLDEALRSRAGVDTKVKGVMIMKVPAESPAFEARLMRGDVIVQANQTATPDIKSLERAVQAAEKQGKGHALLRINRRGAMQFATIPTKPAANQ